MNVRVSVVETEAQGRRGMPYVHSVRLYQPSLKENRLSAARSRVSRAIIVLTALFCTTTFASALEEGAGFGLTGGTAKKPVLVTQTGTVFSPKKTPDFNILTCPFAIFREAYLGVFETSEHLAIMALEDEAISACANRQTKVNLVLEQEEKLRDLLGKLQNETAAAKTDAFEADALEMHANTQAAVIVEPASDARLVLDALEEESILDSDAHIAPVICTYTYGVETAGHQRWGDGAFIWATLSRGDGQTFVVKVGDLLPGDLRVHEVTKKGVFVENPEGDYIELPRAPLAPPEVVDLNFKYNIVSMAEQRKKQAAQEAASE